MSAATLRDNLWREMRIQVTEEEAQQYLDRFFQTYPGVERYITTTKNFVSQFNFTHTFTGRRRRFPIAMYNRSMISRMARQAVNARIQTTSADMVGTNIVDLHEAIRPLGGRVILTVHDSILFQLPKGTTGVKDLLDEAIVSRVAERFDWLPVSWKYDCGWGPSYGEAKYEVTNGYAEAA